ncbi:TPA: hypothetical protein ACWLTD_000469 [Morganella morganii]
MSIEQISEILGKIQFNQTLSPSTYILIALITAAVSFISVYTSRYFSEKSNLRFIKNNFEEITEQLKKNTETTKNIEHQFIHKTWVSQQTWVKKQEIYEDIFKLFIRIDKYLTHEEHELNEYYWYHHGIFQYLYTDRITSEQEKELMQEQEEYIKSQESTEQKEKSSDIKKLKKDISDTLASILQIKAIFLSEESENIISHIVKMIEAEPNNDEEWNQYVTDSIENFKKYKGEFLIAARKELSLSV